MTDSVLSEYSDDAALDFEVFFADDDRLEFGIGGFEPDAAVLLPVVFLQGGVGAVDQGHHHLAILGGFLCFDYNVVAIANLFVDHGVAADTENESVLSVEQFLGDGNLFVGLDGFYRFTGGDGTEEGKFALPRGGRHNFKPPVLIGRPV